MLKTLLGLKKYIIEDNLTKIFLLIAMLALILFISKKNDKEYFENQRIYTSSNNQDIFDNNYIDLYNNIIIDTDKNKYFVNKILEQTNISTNSNVLNIGCKTGNINKLLQDIKIKSVGLDQSKFMINYCKNNYSNIDFDILDIKNIDSVSIFTNNVSHILCLNMEIYYLEDIDLFFSKCYNLLDNNGYLIIHLVDYKKFNNTSVYSRFNNFNPNNLSIKKVNDSVIKFNDIIYNTKYRIYPNDFGRNTVTFTETIENNNSGNIHEYIHSLNMLTNTNIKKIAKDSGFKLEKIIDIDLPNYNNEYIYVFVKDS